MTKTFSPIVASAFFSMMVLMSLVTIPKLAHADSGIGGRHLAAVSDPIQFTPEVPIPGTEFSGKTIEVNNDTIGEYIKAIYTYFIWVVGLIATFMVVYGGVKWISAAGNPGRINDARETINNAVIGVIIALTSVLLLNIINPDFVKLGLPDISSVQKRYFVGALATNLCPREQNVECGDLLTTGRKIIDPNGASADEYCIGTLCKVSRDVTVCALSQATLPTPPGDPQELTVYSPAGGCVDTIPLKQPAPPEFAGTPSLKAQIGLPGRSCRNGGILLSEKAVSADCDEKFGDKFRACYIALLPGQVYINGKTPLGENTFGLRKMGCTP